jgi:hypothetical protein
LGRVAVVGPRLKDAAREYGRVRERVTNGTRVEKNLPDGVVDDIVCLGGPRWCNVR